MISNPFIFLFEESSVGTLKNLLVESYIFTEIDLFMSFNFCEYLSLLPSLVFNKYFKV